MNDHHGDCPHGCGHKWGSHDLVATGLDVTDGGVTICPHPGCLCYSTWSTEGKGRESVREPSPAELAEIRADCQGFWEAIETGLT